MGSSNIGLASSSQGARRALTQFAAAAVVLGFVFFQPLLALVLFALNSDLYSHVLLIPAIALYLGWLRRTGVLGTDVTRSPGWAGLFVAIGVGLLALRWEAPPQALQDRLFLSVMAFSALVVASAFWFCGARMVWRLGLPFGLLLFLAPFPKTVETGFEEFLQHASAEAASWLFTATGTPFLRDGLVFQLPNIVLSVAPECSGIHSTLVLFITGLIAGGLFLQRAWSRTVLAMAVVLLGIVRNGFRIVTIGLLCVHVDPSMIHSWIHRKGGPLFFALSLVAFFGLLLLLMRLDPPRAKPSQVPA